MEGFLLLIQLTGDALLDHSSPGGRSRRQLSAPKSANCAGHQGHRLRPSIDASADRSDEASPAGAVDIAGRTRRPSTCPRSDLTCPPPSNRLPRAVAPAGASPSTPCWNSCSIQVTRGGWPKGPLNHPTAGDLEGLSIDVR